MLRVLVIALVLLVAVMLAIPRDRAAPGDGPPGAHAAGAVATENATVLYTPLEVPEFSLTRADGTPFTKASLEDRFSLMFFGFTNCPDVCPITLQVLASAVERIEQQAPEAAPDVVFVSVDPRRDTPERIREYLERFSPSFAGVTGPDDALEPLLDALGINVEQHEHDGEEYNVLHSGVVFFFGPRAEVIALSSPPNVPAAIASDFLRVHQAYVEGRLSVDARLSMASR